MNYSNSKVYKLVNTVDSKIYVGSTCSPLAKRLGGHKKQARKYPDRRVYAHINSIGWNNTRIVLVEAKECKNKDELRALEQKHIDLLHPELNKKSAINTCTHGRQQFQCAECEGAGICEHKRRNDLCKECEGVGICEHKRRRKQCKECGGSQICIHNIQRNACKECSNTRVYDYCCERWFPNNKSMKRHENTANHQQNANPLNSLANYF